MSIIKTKCRICTEEIRTKSAGFHDTDVDHLKYKYKLKILFEDLILEEDDTTPFVLCLFCVEKIRKTFEFRKQCLDAYQYWGIHFGREQSKSIDLNFKIIPSVDNHFTRYEFVPTNTSTTKDTETTMDKQIKKEIEEPVPLLGNMKNKLNSLLKQNTPVESPEPAPILSLTLLRRKRTYKKKTPDSPTPEEAPKPILNIDKLKQNLNKQINIAPVDIKTEPDDEDMPLNCLKRKLNEEKKNAAVAAAPPVPSAPALNLFSLKNKLVTALKIAETAVVDGGDSKTVNKSARRKKHHFIFDVNEVIADRKNNIFYCKYCYRYFQHGMVLRYHIQQHSKTILGKKQTGNGKVVVEQKKKKKGTLS